MKYRPLGKTDLSVSVVAMGCWSIVGDRTWGQQSEKESIATLEAALEAGINFFDTAEGYGNGYSEQLLGKAFSGHRSEVIIASKPKSSKASTPELKRACEDALQRLNTDYIDLYQVHWPNRSVPFEQTYAGLQELLQEGKIRTIGLCNFGVGDLSDYLQKCHAASNQLPYNLLWRAIEFEIKPLCLEHDIGILSYSSLAQALLTGKFASADEVPEGRARTRHFSKMRPQTVHRGEGQEAATFAVIESIREISREAGHTMTEIALAWLIHQTGITSVLAGARNPEQARKNAAAAAVNLPESVVHELNQATDQLKTAFGRNADMWRSESRYR